MIGSGRFFVVLAAAVLLAVSPGPGMLYVLARSLAGGRREGFLSALGTFAGGLVHVFAAAAGISIVLAKSALAFSVVKYLGAAYLVFLGIRMLRDARRDDAIEVRVEKSRRNPFWQGVMTEVLNPKTALFFLSFIPQFVDRSLGHVPLQFAVSTGPCAGSERTAPATLPFSADYPHPQSWWSGGAHPFTPYRGT